MCVMDFPFKSIYSFRQTPYGNTLKQLLKSLFDCDKKNKLILLIDLFHWFWILTLEKAEPW